MDFIQYPFSEIPHPVWGNPCCGSPPLQLADAPPPELFDQECDNDEEVIEFDCPAEKMDTFFPSSPDTTPTISTKISTPSALTYSTDSSYEIDSSQYSFNATSSSESDYLNLSEFGTHGSVNSWLYSQAAISSPEFTYIPPLNPAEAHGTMELDQSFLADDCSTAMQQLSVTCVNPAALSGTGEKIDTSLSAHVISDSEAQNEAPVKKPFKCPHCRFCKSEPIRICKLAHSSG
jgi:hypothetical protein